MEAGFAPFFGAGFAPFFAAGFAPFFGVGFATFFEVGLATISTGLAVGGGAERPIDIARARGRGGAGGIERPVPRLAAAPVDRGVAPTWQAVSSVSYFTAIAAISLAQSTPLMIRRAFS